MARDGFRSTFTYAGRPLTVALTSTDETQILNAQVTWEASGTVDRPTERFGHVVPATFRVDGLPYDVTFTTAWSALVEHEGFHGVTLDTLTVAFRPGLVPRDLRDLPSPVVLLRHAGKASRVRGYQLPPGWHDPNYPDVELQAFHTSDGSDSVYIALGPSDAPHDHDALMGRPRRERNNKVGPELLQRVADVHNAAPNGSKEHAIMQALDVSKSSARKYIAKARSAGLLPPVPATDGRTRKGAKR